jgi:hypothetical protein
MARTKRVSPHQHYHVETNRNGDKWLLGTFRFAQGRGGANEHCRDTVKRSAKLFGPCAEANRIGVGSWVLTTWNRPADDYDSPGRFRIVSSEYYSTRVCFEADHLAGLEVSK